MTVNSKGTITASQWKSVTELTADVKAGRVTASQLVERSLKTIDNTSEYAAILCTLEVRAREQAAAIDRAVANGEPVGVLAGVPYIAKDNFLVFGGETTAASNMLKGFEAPYQATAIERLEAEGAICVAKANLDAFAHGGSTENSDFLITKNPHDKTRVPGGSSGGSAAAVVLDMVPFALGTDTGGSIRQPAGFSGCVGYKPTYGLVSRSGVVAMASSLDTIGPMTRTVEDAAAVLDVIAGKDPLDSTTIERQANYKQLSSGSSDGDNGGNGDLEDLKGKKIGIIQEYMADGLEPGVKQALERTFDSLRAAGAQLETVSLPSLPLALAAYYIICPAEISSNLSRYDGQRFGYSYKQATNLEESLSKSRDIGFGNEAKLRIMLGTYVLSSGYYDAYYKKAQTVRTKLAEEFNRVFMDHDFLIGPIAATTAFKLGEYVSDPLQMYLSDIMTVAVNLVGIPAISMPCGNADGLPVGVQLMAPQKHDLQLLGVAKAVESLGVC